MLIGGEAASERGKERDDTSWVDTDLIEPKNEENRPIQLLQMDGEDLKQ
jgi:hypothetical protein